MTASGDAVETPLGVLPVVRAGPDDAEEVLRLRDDLARWMRTRAIVQWRPGEFPLEWFQRWVDEGCVYVVRTGDAVVASVTVLWEDPVTWGDVEDPAGYIHLLMVGRDYAGHRVGEALLSWAEDHIRRSGQRLARLDCARTNGWLRGYYERAGYRLVGYRDFPEFTWALEAALYEKSLDV